MSAIYREDKPKIGCRQNIITVFVVVGISVCLLVSCQAGKPSADIAATVNNAKIYKSDIKQRLDAIQKAQPNMFNGKAGEIQKKELESRIVDSLVSEQLLIEEATKRGAKISESEADKKAKEIFNSIPPEAKKQQGLTIATLKDNLKRQMALDFLQKEYSKKLKVSEAEVKAYYDKNKKQFPKETFAQAKTKITQIITSQKAFAEIQKLLNNLKNEAKIWRADNANSKK